MIKLSKKKMIIDLILALIVSASVSSYFIFVPKIINIEGHRKEIESIIKKEVKDPIILGKLHTSLTWDLKINISADNIIIKHNDNSPFIQTGEASVLVSIPELINNTVNIKEIKIIAPFARIKRLKNSHFDIEELIPKDTTEGKYKVVFPKTKLRVENYLVKVDDNYIIPHKSYIITGKFINIKELTPNQMLNGSIDAQISATQKPFTNISLTFKVKLPLNTKDIFKNTLSLDGTIDNLHPSTFTKYINEVSGAKFALLKGNANLKYSIKMDKDLSDKDKFFVEGSIDNIRGVKKNKGIVFDIPLSNFKLDAGIKNKKLVINQAYFIDNNAKIKLQGSIANFLKHNKVLNLDINIKNSRVEEITRIFPKEIYVPKDAINKLKKYNAKGLIDGNISIKGYYKKPELFGHINYKDFSIIDSPAGIPGGSGYVDFNGKTLFINTKTYITPKGYVVSKGYINPLFDRTLHLKIKSNTTDIHRADMALLALQDIIGFRMGTVPLMRFYGTGDVDLKIDGQFKNPHLYGYINVKNGKATYEGLAGVGHNINGQVIFKDQNVIYDKLSGYVKTTKVYPSGYSNLDAFSDVKLKLVNVNLKDGLEFVNNSSLLYQVKKALRMLKNPSGITNGEVNLKGTAENLQTWGSFTTNGANTYYDGLSQEIKNVSGKIRYTTNEVFFDNLTGNVANSKVSMNGKISNSNIANITFSSTNIDLSHIRQLVLSSSLLKPSSIYFKDFKSLNGNAEGILTLIGDINSPESFNNLKIKSVSGEFVHNDFAYPVKIFNGSAIFYPNQMVTTGLVGESLDTPITVTGKFIAVKNIIKPYASVKFKDFSLDKFKIIANNKYASPDVKKLYAHFDKYNGKVSGSIKLNDAQCYSNLFFNNASFNYKKQNLPIKIRTGNIISTPNTLKFNHVYSKISSSPVFADGSILHLTTIPELNIQVIANLRDEDVQRYIIDKINTPIIEQGNLPIAAVITGKLNNWNLLGQIAMNKETNLLYKNEIGFPKDKVKIISLKASGNTNNINIDNMEVALGNNMMQAALSASSQSGKVTNLEQMLYAKGGIKNILSTPSFDNFLLKTPNPITVKIFNPAIKMSDDSQFFTNGTFKSDLILQGNLFEPHIKGNIILKDIAIPSKETNINSANMNMSGQNLIINNANLNIANSQIELYANIDDIFDNPLLIKDIRVSSPSLNIDKISELFKEYQVQPESNVLPPIIITDGTVKADELIVNNLITTNFLSQVSFTPDWLLSLSALSLDTAGGNASGEFLYNLKNSSASARFNIKDMQANAVATTLMSMPNEVYGMLNGNVEFTTKGTTSQDLIANANGAARFTISNGRLVRLGSLEYLLRAVNIIQSGVGGLNINSILDLIAPQNTGYFNTLDGSISAKDGIIKTDNISTSGKNLSLSLNGSFDMATNNANVLVLGNLSKKISGLLGPLGSVSINTFIDFIPGIGFLPTNSEKGLIDIIPGLSKIPGLGLGGGKTRKFAVKIEGDLYNPTSVKSFRWLN